MNQFKFWGSATVGTKGQVVIPAEAREVLNIHEGDKLLMMSPPNSDSIMMVQPDVLEQHMQGLQSAMNEMLDQGDKKDRVK